MGLQKGTERIQKETRQVQWKIFKET